MDALKGVNAIVAFLLELAMLVSFGYWGYRAAHGLVVKWALALALPVAAMVVWGLFFAPQAIWRLSLWPGVVGSLSLFWLAALALQRAGQRSLAIVVAAVAFINAAFALFWQQW